MSLLKKLQSALNTIYDGNTLNTTEPEKDMYYCGLCEDYVTEDRWNEKHQCCYSCWFNQ